MKPVQQATFEQIEEFVLKQVEDEIIDLSTDEIGSYVRQHLELLHNLILGQISYGDACEQLKEMEV